MLLTSKENYEKAIKMESEKPSTKEVIMYFDEDELSNIPSGFSNCTLKDIYAQPLFEKRSLLEYVESKRQPIPYCIVKHQDEFFLTLREKGSGEARLVGQKGFLGGHVDRADTILTNNRIDLNETFKVGMLRELSEEAGIDKSMIADMNVIGMINIREKGSVENDHLGIVYFIELNTKEINTQEEGILSGLWYSLEEVKKEKNLENWARIVFDNL